MGHSPVTIRLTHRKLPHWEVEHGRYFITVRCADSLPEQVLARLVEIHRTMERLPVSSAGSVVAQRRQFLTLEKYLDAGHGACPLRQPAAAKIVVDELSALRDWQIDVPHLTVMPNHWHALLVPQDSEAHSPSQIMKRVKGRTAKRIRQLLPGHGRFWQGEWFDRWVRGKDSRGKPWGICSN